MCSCCPTLIPSKLPYFNFVRNNYASHLARFCFVERCYHSLDSPHYFFLHYMARCGCQACSVCRSSVFRRVNVHCSHGQTLNRVVLCLRRGLFVHGCPYYVGLPKDSSLWYLEMNLLVLVSYHGAGFSSFGGYCSL